MATTEKATATAIVAVKETAKEIAAEQETDRCSDINNSNSVSDSYRNSDNFDNRVVAIATVTEIARDSDRDKTATAAVTETATTTATETETATETTTTVTATETATVTETTITVTATE